MRRLTAIPCALVALVLASCGGSSSSPSSTPATSNASGSGGALALAADSSGRLKFNKASLSARAGTVAIDFSNGAPLGHNLTVASSSGAVVGATPTFQGGSKSLTLKLKPGTYTFYCSVPGHRQGGMQGTLVVK